VTQQFMFTCQDYDSDLLASYESSLTINPWAQEDGWYWKTESGKAFGPYITFERAQTARKQYYDNQHD
jgi:hypothetical protein